ncbi:hypothetical protein QQP08_001251 [Theobroma cacao]|nr:hypothetical protein QQP08_001251 [Theobroma cacao]
MVNITVLSSEMNSKQVKCEHDFPYVFTTVGLQEFFYDQVPNELTSTGLSRYLIFRAGNFLIPVIDKSSGNKGRKSWFADNLHQVHLDYFYWLFAWLNVCLHVLMTRCVRISIDEL